MTTTPAPLAGDDAPADITVVAGVIDRDGHVLVTRRLRGTHLEGLWEFPGGKVERAETHDAALRRELREELDADVAVHELLLSTRHEYPERTIELFFYRCTLIGEARAVLGQELQWVSRPSLRALAFPPADSELIDLLTSAVQYD